MAAGLDLFPVEDGEIPGDGTMHMVNIGVQFAIPTGSYGQKAARSGLSKLGVTIRGGVIDLVRDHSHFDSGGLGVAGGAGSRRRWRWRTRRGCNGGRGQVSAHQSKAVEKTLLP